MSKEELEEKIKNEETVYGVSSTSKNGIFDIAVDGDYYIQEFLGESVLYFNNYYVHSINLIFSTKTEAQHYLDNSNVTRTDKLPFVTWEEFKKNPYFNFIDKKSRLIEVRLNLNKDRIYITNPDYVMTDFDYTDDGFYEAYKICRKLFLGEE